LKTTPSPYNYITLPLPPPLIRYAIAVVHTIHENTRQHQTKENSQSSIQSFHVRVQAACITTVIPMVDCSTRWLQRKRPALCNVSKDYPLPACNAYNKLPTPLPPCWALYNMWTAPRAWRRKWRLRISSTSLRSLLSLTIRWQPVTWHGRQNHSKHASVLELSSQRWRLQFATSLV